MRTIYKFPLYSLIIDNLVSLPEGAEVLTARFQNGTMHLWVLLDPTSGMNRNRVFKIFGTGFDIPDSDELKYIATDEIGALIFHVFEVLQ